MSNHSTFLFARPSFMEGIARVMDIGATMQIYNGSKTENEADLRASKHDWQAVGEDILSAVENYERRQ